jgi:SNF2 family DNA or RNA helicase
MWKNNLYAGVMLKLHNYQERIVDFCTNNASVVLSVGMGLGKSIATLTYLDRTRPQTCIIIAPKRVAETVWKQEAIKWGLTAIHDKMTIVAGTPAKRKQALSDATKPYKIIGRDNIKDIEGYQCELLVLDELTSFKNHLSKRSLACYSIRASTRIGLTGTFLANGAIDIYGQMLAVGCGDISAERAIKNNFFRWRATYFRDKLAGSGLQFQKWELVVPLEVLLEPLKKHIFTLSSEDYLDIPEVSYINHEIELSDKEMKQYLSLQTMLHLELDGEHYSVNEAAKFCKLQTLTNGFIYDVNGEAIRGEYSTKLDAVVEFVDRAVSEGERVLLWYAFREEAIWLGEKMKEKGIRFCSPTDKRWLEKFESNEIDVLISHPASIGHGVNVQHCSRICVWSSLTFNFEYWGQANARLARQGQKRGVQIHVFASKGTCERNQYLSLMKKSKEQDNFIAITK